MKFEELNNKEYYEKMNEYKEEAKLKYQDTKAYAEYEKRSKNRRIDEEINIGEGLDKIIGEFSEYLGKEDCTDELNALVNKYQRYITDNFYECTDEILIGLSELYISDSRFKNNINKHGEGTAELLNKAINSYLNNN